MSWFIDIIDKPKLVIEEPENNIQPITDFKDEKTRKVSEYATKKKVRYNNLCAPMQKAFAAGFITFLLPCPLIPTLLSYLKSPTLLLSYSLMSNLLFYLLMPSLLSCLLMPNLLSCFPMPGLLSFLVLALLSPSIPLP